jgi:hypothetical protein
MYKYVYYTVSSCKSILAPGRGYYMGTNVNNPLPDRTRKPEITVNKYLNKNT